MSSVHRLSWPKGEMLLDRCRVMGILNVTPDSFSDGGAFIDPVRAVARAWGIAKEGADLLDVGAESTRPGADAVHEAEEKKRLWPVLERMRNENYPLPISLDSSKPHLVAAALDENLAQMVNDVEGLRNQEMVAVVKDHAVPVILMHMFGSPRTMQEDFHYDDVVRNLGTFFRERLKKIGLTENVVLDPGIGFGKSVAHNLSLLHRLGELCDLGHPVLIGASRKSFIGKILDLSPEDRMEGSLAAAVVAAYNGASIVRVHDVQSTVRAVRMAESVRRETPAP